MSSTYIMYHIKTESYDTDEPLYTKLRDGPGTLFVPESRVAKDYFRTGLYERSYIKWAVENFADPTKNIIDIGAHIGMYTIAFGKKVNHIYSFECSPKSFNYFCANLLLHDLSYNVTKFNCALSDKEGNAKYFIRDPLDGGGNGISGFLQDERKNTPTIDCPTRTLDSFGLTNVNFIKIDVEGHEEFVLRGAVETLKNNGYPKILFESWPERYEQVPAKELRTSLFSFIESLGYSIVQIHGGTDDMFLAEKKL